MIQEFFIPGPMPNLNDLIDAMKSRRVVNKDTGKRVMIYPYQALKKKWEQIVGWSAISSKIRPMPRVWFYFVWIEKNKRRDPDNVTAGGRKIILDGLVQAKLLNGDGWEQVAGWKDDFAICRNRPGVIVRMFSEEPDGEIVKVVYNERSES